MLEGVAFGMADGFDALLASGIDVHSISVIGGGSQSSYWGRILAAVLKRPLVYREGAATGPALGAARLARYAMNKGDFEAAFEAPRAIQVIEPHDSDTARLEEKRDRFTRLYSALAPEFTGAT